MNTADFLALSRQIVPDRLAIVFDEKRLTFRVLEERVNRLANALAASGVVKGDRVGIMAVNCNAQIEAYFASAMLDAIFVPLNFRAKADELSYLLSDSKPKALFAGHRYVSLIDSINPSGLGISVMFDLEGTAASNWLPYEEVLQSHSSVLPFSPQAADEDVTVLVYSSGTTAFPKGVMLTHNTFSSYILNNVDLADPKVDERTILSMPLFHVAGLQAMMVAVFGGRTITLQRQFEPVEWMKLVEREKATRAMLVPTMLQQLMDHPEFGSYDLSSLEVITYGAAPMLEGTIMAALDNFPNVRLTNAYGQTETGATITALPPEDQYIPPGLSPKERQKRIKRLTSIGKPLPDVEVRIVDEHGNDVGIGKVGELVAKGERLMKGYWNNPEATQATVHDGWLHTGDVGYHDDDGYIYLTDRIKDFIKRGGDMISPAEVESVLLSHPQIEDASVIGIPDKVWGEKVMAVLVPKGDAKPSLGELVEHCKVHLTSSKCPAALAYRSELPRNQLGKVLKRVLREEYTGQVAV